MRWKPIPGFSHYLINDLGDIRRTKLRTGWGIRDCDRPVRSSESMYGYMQVRLISTKGVYRYFRVHRLVALVFIGRPPKGQPEVNHRNGDKTDNHVLNLEYVSRQENALHSSRVLMKQVGSKHPAAKLTEEQVIQIRAEYVPRVTTYAQLAQKYGVSKATISHVVTRLIWTHI